MNCPKCSREMQKGFIQCRDMVVWTPKKQPVAAFSFLGRGGVTLGGNEYGLSDTCAAAYQCPDCQTVIIEY